MTSAEPGPERLFAPQPGGYAPTTFDVVGRFPHHWVDYRARVSPDRIAASQDGVDWTFREFRDRTVAYASAVTTRTPRTGVCVALISGSTVEMLAAMLGVMRAGRVAVPLAAVDGAQRGMTVLDDVEPALVLGDRGSLDLVADRHRAVLAFEAGPSP